tara:strand:+ start:329 stop:1240 length:912 start_codon:yes stop_codon:yes gene_type:complete
LKLRQIKSYLYMHHIKKIILIVSAFNLLHAKQDNTKLDFQYKLKKFDALRMYFDIGIGNLVLTPSNNRYILTSDIHYNPNLKKPIINLSDKNNIAKLDVKINPHKNFNKENSKTLFNNLMEDGSDNYKLNFQMPTKISTDVNFNFGIGKVNLDFTNLRISQLKMDCGLSDVTMINNKSNLVNCEIVQIETGVADFNSSGLGNFNASKYVFDIGMGSADIDLSGSINKDCDLKINVSVGSLELTLPKNKNIELKINKNMFSSVNVDGLVSKGEGKYTSKESQKRWSTIKTEISVGLGSLDIIVN